MELTQEKAHELFEYKDGELFFKPYKISLNRQTKKAGWKVGTDSGHGYLSFQYQKKKYYIHQIIFLMQYGYIPKLIDHIDGNGMNNKIDNLREADKIKNSYNAKIRTNNTTGHKGVVWHKNGKKWMVSITENKKIKYLGLYNDFELACLVSDEARDLYHGKFARI